MWFKFKHLRRLFFTLKDVGFVRIMLRVKYEIIKLIDQFLSPEISIFLTPGTKIYPNFYRRSLW